MKKLFPIELSGKEKKKGTTFEVKLLEPGVKIIYILSNLRKVSLKQYVRHSS